MDQLKKKESLLALQALFLPAVRHFVSLVDLKTECSRGCAKIPERRQPVCILQVFCSCEQLVTRCLQSHQTNNRLHESIHRATVGRRINYSFRGKLKHRLVKRIHGKAWDWVVLCHLHAQTRSSQNSNKVDREDELLQITRKCSNAMSGLSLSEVRSR